MIERNKCVYRQKIHIRELFIYFEEKQMFKYTMVVIKIKSENKYI